MSIDRAPFSFTFTSNGKIGINSNWMNVISHSGWEELDGKNVQGKERESSSGKRMREQGNTKKFENKWNSSSSSPFLIRLEVFLLFSFRVLFTRFDINYARNIECCASYVRSSSSILIVCSSSHCHYCYYHRSRHRRRRPAHTCKFNEYIK